MKTIKIFIASSIELKKERLALELLLYRKNSSLKEKNIVLQPVLWEILEGGFAEGRKQDEFNEALLDCDIVMCLFYKVVGKFTIEEFENAYERFKIPDQKPFKLYVFFKEGKIELCEFDQFTKVQELKKKIVEEYQEFYKTYITIEELENQVSKELELIIPTIIEKQSKFIPTERKQSLKKHFVPRRPRNFVNRNREINKIINSLKNFDAVQVQGLAGIGKSDLATEIAYRVEDYFTNGIIWHFAKKTSIDEIMSVIAKAFNIDNLQGLKEEKVVVIKQTLSNKRVLLIFDNVEQPSEEAIQEILDIANNCAILITTRTTENVIFKNAKQYKLDELTPNQSFMLFEKIEGSHLKDEQKSVIRELYEKVGGIPLALELIITWAKSRGFEIQKLSDWLKEKGLESIIRHEEKLESIFRNSYDGLNPQEKMIFSTMGIFGGQTCDLDALKYITKDEEAELHVYRFISLSLVKRAALENRFYLHPLLKYFAQKKATDPNIYESMIQYFNSYSQKHSENFTKLDMEKDNIYSALDIVYEKKDYQRVIEFVNSLIGKKAYYGFLARKGYWTEAIKRLGQASEASKELNDRELEARQYKNLGLFHYWLGNNNEAREFYSKASEIFSNMKNISEIIEVYHNMGYVEDDENFYEKARTLYEDSLKISKENNDEELIALSYHLVGVIDYHQGRYDDARKNMEKGLKINERLGKKAAISRSKRRFAAVARMQAHYSTGEQKQRYINEAFVLIKDSLGQEEIKRSRARGQRQLGMIYEENGQIDIAHECYLESRRIFESIGNIKGIGTVSYNLGSIAQKKGDFVKAKSYYEESIKIAKSVNSRYGIASALRQLGLIALAEGESSKAKDYLSDSFQIFEEIDSTFKGEVKELLNKINISVV